MANEKLIADIQKAHSSGDKELANNLMTILREREGPSGPKINSMEEIPSAYKEGGESWYEDLGEGVGYSGLKTYYGIKDMLPDSWTKMDDEDRATLKDWKEDAGQSGWGTAGEIAGDVGQFLVPGTAAFKAAKAAGKGWKTIAGAEAGVGAMMGGTQLPGEGESRLGNAATEGALSLVGSGAGKAIGKYGQGMLKSEAGKKLMGLMPDYNFSPATLLESQGVKSVQKLFEDLPVVSRRARKKARLDNDAMNVASLRSIAENSKAITEPGSKGFDILDEQLTGAYSKAWKDVGEVPEELPGVLLQQIDELTRSKPFLLDETVSSRGNMKEINVLNGIMDRADSLFLENTTDGLKGLDGYINSLSNKLDPTEQFDLKQIVDGLKQTTRDFIPDADKVAKLKSLDDRWPSLLAMNEAVESSAGQLRDGVWKPQELMAGVKKIANGRDFGKGGGPMRELADVGKGAFKKPEVETQGPVMSALFRLLKAAPGGSVLPMRTVGNRMTGQGWEQRLAKALGSDGKGGIAAQVGVPALTASMAPEEKKKAMKEWLQKVGAN